MTVNFEWREGGRERDAQSLACWKGWTLTGKNGEQRLVQSSVLNG